MLFIRRVVIGFALGCLIQGTMLHSSDAPYPAVDAGAWRLTSIDDPAKGAVCVTSREQMLKVGMPSSRCARRFTALTASEWIVQFTCADVGLGRSAFRRLDSETLLIETQGVAHGQPFAANYEAKRLARCS